MKKHKLSTKDCTPEEIERRKQLNEIMKSDDMVYHVLYWILMFIIFVTIVVGIIVI